MKILIKSVLFCLTALIYFSSCKQTKYNFGDLIAPSNLTVTAVVSGANASAPNGDGTGSVVITATANNTITYKIDFGDGTPAQLISSGTVTHKYSIPDTNKFTITVNAIGKGGTTSTSSTQVKVYVSFQIPAAIVTALTSDASKVWIVANDVQGHFGVGDPKLYTPNYYSAAPNSRQACFYTDELTFSKDASGNVLLSNNNMGQSFIIGAAASFYGFSTAETCENIDVSGIKKLIFSGTVTNNPINISTNIQFLVPGNGILTNGTGGTIYEILSISSTQISLRNIGADGNAWYQIIKPK